MSDIAVKVEGLGKQYNIGGQAQTYDRLGDQMVDMLAAPFRRAGKLLRGHATGAAELDETIWALKDISLEIKHGEIVGVIGRNGAGKSTFLKVLSRITVPTEGYADIYGRVGSLLEVGTGFHPELTGRENVFLNGAILGMSKQEIDRKFDEIVAFAEIEKFIDTPVKHYSSGMYVRLAFSVAAHLEPEILLVDEVLAVGDVAFQRKCLGKMDDVGKEGRTVLFVSHNMGLLQSLCQRGLYLHDGRLTSDGPINQVVDAYLKTLEQFEAQDLSQRTDRRGKGLAKLTKVAIINGDGHSTTRVQSGQPVQFIFHVDNFLPDIGCDFFLYNHFGQPLAAFSTKIAGTQDVHASNSKLEFICEIDEMLLLPGRYRLDVVILGDNRLQDAVQAATFFDVDEGLIQGRPGRPMQRYHMTIPHRWILPQSKSRN